MAKLSYKVSYYIFYVLIALILVVLGLFFGVGYNNPMGEYNAPEHTETLMLLMYAMLAICVLEAVEGVESAVVSHNDGTAIVSGEALDIEALVSVVTNAGYKAEA